MTTLAQIPTERKPLNRPLTESSIDPAMVGPFTNAGSIVIRIGLGGSYAVEILAESSVQEEVLRERLTAAWPALEWIQRTIQTGGTDAVGVRG